MTLTDSVLLGPDGLRLRYTPAPPSPKQAAALAVGERELLVHGAGGGGKTWGLLAGALQFADVPGYHALILRKTLTDLTLPGGLIGMTKGWLADHPLVRYNANERRVTFELGATLTFGYLGDRPDEMVQRYRGGEWQYIGIDMIDELPGRVDEEDPDAGPVLAPHWFMFLFSKLRRPFGTRDDAAGDGGVTRADVPLRMRVTAGDLRTPADPAEETPGRRWVHHRYIDGPEPRPASISSSYRDNPMINIAKYEAALAKLTPEMQRRLTHGDWTDRG